MKKFTIAVISLLMISALLPALSVTAFAENYVKGWNGDVSGSCFFDGADIFSDEQEAELTEKIRETAQRLEMNILVFAAGPSYSMSDGETERFADGFYDEAFGKDTDGVFFFMDLTGDVPAYDYISTSGKAVLNYQDHISDMFEEINAYLPSSGSDYSLHTDDFANAVVCFLGQLSEYNGKKSYYYDGDSGKYFYYKNGELVISKEPPLRKRLTILLFALPAGAVAAIIYYFSIKSTYKFKASMNPNVYVSSEDTRFVRREDRFIRTYTTKTKIETSSGGGHGGGGGGGGGGHGGGGSHR